MVWSKRIGQFFQYAFFLFILGGFSMNAHAQTPLFDFELNDINGKPVKLRQYQGKVLLLVNTASKCGLTPQYASLQDLYEAYQEEGFEVLAFPANNFGNQEPGTNEEIESFCDLRFKIKFPLFSKISVKGKDIHPLYKYLTTQSQHTGSIKWNFSKFLVDRNGEVVARYSPMKNPMDADVRKKIEELLKT